MSSMELVPGVLMQLFEPLGEESVMSDTFIRDYLKLHGI